MQHHEQVRLLERARLLVGRGETDLDLPGGTIPVDRYIDAARLEQERERLFGRLPILVGFTSQLRAAGDWFTDDATGVPILCVRGDDGKVHAFLNVCRHRGSRLVTGTAGSARTFSCGFHGWTYDLAGALCKVPLPAAFPDLDRNACGLVELPTGERHGFVFVVPKARGAAMPDLDTFLGPLLAELGSFGLGDFTATRIATQTRRLNWKLHMDATQEVYHLPHLHATTAGAGYFQGCSLLTHTAPHARMVMPGASVLGLRDDDRAQWRLLTHAAVVYAMFPNTTLLLHDGFVQMLSVFPIDPDTSLVRTAMLVPPGPADAAEEHRRVCHHALYLSTMAEDLAACEQMQANMRTGANAVLRLGRAEGLVAAFDRTVDDLLEPDRRTH